MENIASQTSRPREPWNKGKLVGQKAPFKLKEVWAIRVWLQLEHRTRELALYDLFPRRVHSAPHLGTRQYARIVDNWVNHVGPDPCAYGTHSKRRTKATLIYQRTKTCAQCNSY